MARRADKRQLRSGYTTGACAAAAARAATLALLRQKSVSQVQITLPGGNSAVFSIVRCVYDNTQASCSVIKDAGDDPDITNGAEIRATVSWHSAPGVHIEGGTGVGIVTKPGLEIAVGSPAINPVPRQMIAGEVSSAAGDRLMGRGVEVTISVPEGTELAKRTLNPRLGIVGGISILGTTGIVIPYSVNAYTACISQALDVAVACGCREAVLTTGRRSEKSAQRALALAGECFVQAGDFIGFSLRECRKRGLAKAVVWGMAGKLSKLAAGHLYTNVSHSDVDIMFLTGVARDCGISGAVLKALEETVSANHFLQVMPGEYLGTFASRLCLLAAQKCRDSVGGTLEIECVMTAYDGAVLGSASAKG